MRQVVGLGAVAGQAKSRQSELWGRKARRVWPSVEWRGGSAGGCWAERLALGRFRRAWGWVGLVGHAEWPTRNRSPDRVGTSSDRPLHAERIRRSSEARECAAMGPVAGRVVWLGRKLGMGRGERKKQIPRCARNDRSRLLRRVEAVAEWGGGEVGVIRVRVGGRGGSGGCSCR